MEAPPDCCPSDLDLERYLAFEGDARSLGAVRRHLAACGRCRRLIELKEAQGARFRASHRAVPARARFTRAERQNARKLTMAAVFVPLLAAALGGSVFWHQQQAPAPRVAPAQVQARRGAPVEVREGPAPAPLRELSLRGRPVQLGQGALEAAEGAGPPQPFVLKHTDVEIDVSGFAQRATVTQVFENPFQAPVEAVYVFPLPDDAAVDELELQVGARVIRGEIHRREEARRRYEEAKSQGRRAALLDQERPNLFTQSVANILPGETVKVRLRYVARLRYDDGVFEVNFPLTVGPRYVPGAPLAGESQGTGTSPDTDRVLDASRVTPPLERTGRDVAVRVRLDAALPIEQLWSASHRLWAERQSGSAATVTLDPADRIPNKDLILRWRVAGPALRAATMAAGASGTGTFALMLVPESREAQPEPVPREMVFLIDTSCSMAGPPLAAAKRAIGLALEQMNPDDSFMLIDFADQASAFHPRPLPSAPQHVQRAMAYLSALPSSGGTNQLAGIRAALGRPGEPGRLRTVLFLTDGFIGNEVEVIGEAERLLGEARLFAVGIGSSVNHYLLGRLSESGRGFYQYLRPDEDPNPAIERFVRRIERPLVTDLSVDFGGLAVTQLQPTKLPDLYDAQPLVLLGRYTRPGRGTVTLRGRRGASPVELQVELALPERADGSGMLGALWARGRIDSLERELHQGERGDVIREITTLGLEYKLVTAYTSFVAVDVASAVAPGAPSFTSAEAVDVPELTRAPPPRLALFPVPSPKPRAGGKGFTGDLNGQGHGWGAGSTLGGVGAGGGGVASPSATGRVRGGVAEVQPGAQVMGSLAKDSIQRVIRSHTAELQAAYARRLQSVPHLAGKVVVRLVIDPTGRVAQARVEPSSSLRDQRLEEAILRIVRRWVFPAPAGGGSVVVTYPFLFSPGP